ELHDGHAGTETGFRYRILYVEPRLIQEALGAPYGPLPFVRDGVTEDGRLHAALHAAVEDIDAPMSDLRFDQLLVQLADALAANDASSTRSPVETPHARAVALARDCLDAHLLTDVPSTQLEAITGLSRFALARHFRAALGTSPHRYVVTRRLDRAKHMIQA